MSEPLFHMVAAGPSPVAPFPGMAEEKRGARHAAFRSIRLQGRRAIMSISTRASRARPVTPTQVLAGRLSAGKYEA